MKSDLPSLYVFYNLTSNIKCWSFNQNAEVNHILLKKRKDLNSRLGSFKYFFLLIAKYDQSNAIVFFLLKKKVPNTNVAKICFHCKIFIFNIMWRHLCYIRLVLIPNVFEVCWCHLSALYYFYFFFKPATYPKIIFYSNYAYTGFGRIVWQWCDKNIKYRKCSQPC